MIKQIMAASIILLLCGCKKDKADKVTENKIYFSGIVYTDVNGNIISDEDTTDWKSNDVWTAKEVALFSHNYQTNCATSYGNQHIVAYPNPNNGLFYLFLAKSPTAVVEMRLVDENFNVLISQDSVTSTNLALTVASSGIKDTVRLYYKFIDNGCEFRGHGDIIVQ